LAMLQDMWLSSSAVETTWNIDIDKGYVVIYHNGTYILLENQDIKALLCLIAVRDTFWSPCPHQGIQVTLQMHEVLQ